MSGVIAVVFVVIGDVDFIAQILSMFFMVTYGALCTVSFLEHFASQSVLSSHFPFSLVFIFVRDRDVRFDDGADKRAVCPHRDLSSWWGLTLDSVAAGKVNATSQQSSRDNVSVNSVVADDVTEKPGYDV